MHNFTRNLLTEWRKLNLPFSDKTFVIAISGGADSVSLSLALHELKQRKKLNLRFVLAHFNHHLRGEDSFEDENFVKKFAEKLEFELALGAPSAESKIENQNGNLEQNARLARYAFLQQTARNLNSNGIITAHTLNDQAETFLLNLIRGSGLDGLGGMKPIRDLNFPTQFSEPEIEFESAKFLGIQLYRPLLRWAKREDTENFCRLNETEFRWDSMNKNLAFKRVRIRKVLLPLLKDFNPKIIETIGKTAELLSEDAETIAKLINFQSSKSEKEIDSENFSRDEKEANQFLFLSDLKDVFPSMRRFILREWLKNCRGDLRRLSVKHFEAIENLINSRKSGNTIELSGTEVIIKNKGKLFYKKRTVEKKQTANYN